MSIFDKIESLFGFDVKEFFISYNSFVNSDLQNMISFYKGNTGATIEISKSKLNKLILFSDKILDKVELYKNSFSSSDFFELVDEIEDIRLKLDSYSNLKKWLGVRDYNGKNLQENSINYILSRNESLETASSRVGYNDRDKGGLDLALKNSIKETDYNLDGGFLFLFNYQDGNGSRVDLKTVIDSPLSGENLLGKDLSQEFSFLEEDLEVLTPQETFSQTCRVIMRLKAGDNPEFPFDGIDKSLLVNRATSSISFPIILRQLNSLVSKDDTIRQMTLQDVGYENDSLNLKCGFYTQLFNSKEQVYEN